MKSASVLAALGAVVGVASAHARHNHQFLHQLMKKGSDEVSPVNGTNGEGCGCVTSVVTWYGEATCKFQLAYMIVYAY
jgi:hypothetical protein